MASFGETRPGVASQALPSGVGPNPELRHRHPVCFRAARGLDAVGNDGAEYGGVADHDDFRVAQLLVAPDSPATGIRFYVRGSVELLTPVRCPSEIGVQQVGETARIT